VSRKETWFVLFLFSVPESAALGLLPFLDRSSSVLELLPFNFENSAFYSYLAKAAGVAHAVFKCRREDQVKRKRQKKRIFVDRTNSLKMLFWLMLPWKADWW
jgi:hypothetical protein